MKHPSIDPAAEAPYRATRMTMRGPVWWSSRYATWGWWVVVHCRANSAGVSSPWAEWGRLAL